MTKKEAKAAMAKLLLDHARQQRKRREAAAKRIERIGNLQTKLIYINALGKLPVDKVKEFDEAVALVKAELK